MLIPDDLWCLISDNHDLGGLLCPNCICKRLVALPQVTGVKARPLYGDEDHRMQDWQIIEQWGRRVDRLEREKQLLHDELNALKSQSDGPDKPPPIPAGPKPIIKDETSF